MTGTTLDTIELKDLRFAVERAQVHGWLYDDASGEICWMIEVAGAAKRFGEAPYSQDLRPRFYDEVMPLRLNDWRQLEGSGYVFDLATDDDEGDSAPILYLCSHLSLPRSQIDFGARRGNRFALRWHGLAEANWDDDYGLDMPFRIELDIEFAHQEVRFWHRDENEDFEAAARAVMARRGLSDRHLRYRDYQRFRDDPTDENYRLIRTFFVPID
ncbi:hypothetical protein [Lysobacter sp. CA199]|uniref:hypothetical protein n=1 Tax=Lysobacter sp. CA199 TaxID=3455608 RepID=UPI003F8D4E53